MKRNNNNDDVITADGNLYMQSMTLHKKLEDNIKLFKEIFKNDETVRYRVFRNKDMDKFKCCVIFIDSMVKHEIINENIIQPIMDSQIGHILTHKKIAETVMEKIVVANDVDKSEQIIKLIDSILYGDTVLLIDGAEEGLIFETKGWQIRGIDDPISEAVVRGPREGFTESVITNMTLIRRKIIDSNLKFKFRELGSRTKTKICVSYIDGLAHPKIIEELNKRLDTISIDGVLESGYIEEFIKDSPLSPFHTIGNTERPDVAAASLLEGKVALICDGTPFVLTLPFNFLEYFQASEDYYNNFFFGSINRLLRYISFFLSSSVPAIYLSLITYHQEMIPTPLLLSISASREGVPFPTIFETLAMLLVFEILREAGTRLPKPIGQTVSIVGALVLGEAAVTAKIISAPIVIITALTGITSFLVPKMLGALMITRFIFVILSSVLGLYGYIFGVMGLFIHIMSMRSFGIPYVLPPGPINKQEIKDTFIRAPWWIMYYRPKLIGDMNSIRRKSTNRKGVK